MKQQGAWHDYEDDALKQCVPCYQKSIFLTPTPGQSQISVSNGKKLAIVSDGWLPIVVTAIGITLLIEISA